MDDLFSDVEEIDDVLVETETTRYRTNGIVPRVIAEKFAEIASVAYSGKPEVNTISTTEFSNSNKQILLKQRAIRDNIKLDAFVEDEEAATIGTILHSTIFDQEAPRVTKKIGKWTISGQADQIIGGTIYDLKTMSSYSAKLLKADLEKYEPMSMADLKAKLPVAFKYVSQLSIYNWLYDSDSNIGKILQIIVNHSHLDKLVLPTKYNEIDLMLYSHEEVKTYLRERLDIIEWYQDADTLPDCTQSELGISNKVTYKLVKPGGTRRIAKSKECDTMEAILDEQMKFPNSMVLTIRSSNRPTLCLDFCKWNKANICHQGMALRT